jgi:acetyl-CoA decarbonylase/synthase complex subunit gamma
MAFAVKLVNMETKIEKCTPIIKEDKYKKALEKLTELLSPQVREIEIRSPKKTIKIGGEYVMHRHELTYINPAPIAIDIDDNMSKDEIVKRIDFVEHFEYEYIGRKLNLDLLAIRSVSNDRNKFKEVVKFVSENTSLPLILCTFNPKVMEAGLSVLPDSRPLLYAATKDNWREMGELALKNDLPIVVYSPGDIDTLMTLANTLSKAGISDIALDPGTFVGPNGLRYTLSTFTMLRWKACNEDDKLAGYPLIGTPITAWKMIEGEKDQKMWWETLMAVMLLTRYSNLLIMHSLEGWSYLPVVMWRFNLYTDPRRPVAVDPGVRTIGDPKEDSPVMVTGNYALTYSLVGMDIQSGKVDCYLVITDTEGIAVECAVPGRKFLPEGIAEVLKTSKLDEKVKHRYLIIPGKAARLSGDIEDVTGWKVIVGPQDSKDIPKFVSEKWDPKKLSEIYGN